MKCICGYEEPSFADEDDKFIEIMVDKGSSFTIFQRYLGVTYDREVCLYACPKCKTVRME